MENNELLVQIAQIMEQQIGGLRQEIGQKLERQTQSLRQEMQQVRLDVAPMMEQQTLEMKVLIENDVTRRLDALTDGYKLNHEKQYELERETEQAQVQDLQVRMAALESKSA